MAKVLQYYIWLDGKQNIRTKLRVTKETEFEQWNADGSSTFQASIDSSEILLTPVKTVKIDPKYFNISKVYGDNTIYIVLCEVHNKDNKPHPTNSRNPAKPIFDKFSEQEIMFGLEQEYFIVDSKTNLPNAKNFELLNEGKINQHDMDIHYCYVGITETVGRKISEHHMYACIDCGLDISGTNGEVAPCQWEFQIGPVIGIDASDQLIIARFLLMKIAEIYDCKIDFNSKPFGPTISGSGCHINISTKNMREENGFDHIIDGINKLEKVADRSIEIYGEDNKSRLSGACETASWRDFSYSIGGRDTSIRIGYETAKNKKGYFEDRRPGGNTDFYASTSHILETLS
jgi:glutamine synthetase